MRKFLFVILLLILYNAGYSAAPSRASASSDSFPVVEGPKILMNEQARILQMKRFVDLTPADYEKLSGKKMNVLQRAVFKLSQKRMKNMLHAYSYGNVTLLQKISWFLRGLLFGPLAVLMAYIFTTEDNRELIKWAWFGFAGQVVLIGIVLLIVL
ncbi:MAG: hypothetical protein INR73_06115 [Williamsia sp.]|nr:hypothetical protein [Williamsia sp.]